ncbi:MAG TPA: PAS domain S-box protein [Polyangiaceae bacterium]|nr:PAS domain S-box protein [Polyangiaceae bacterium]
MATSSASAEATLDALADPLLVCTADGRVQYVNASAASLLGESPAAVVGRPALSIFPERLQLIDGIPFLEWLVQTWERLRRPIRVPVLRQDGVEIHQALQVSTTTVVGQGTAVVLVMRPPWENMVDVDQDPLELDTRHPSAERSYRALFESVPVGVLHFDARGRVTAVNELLGEQLGASRSVLIGLDMLTLPDESFRVVVERALAGMEGQYEGELTSEGGATRLLHATFSPILRDGRVEGGVAIVDDVTERRSIEARLARGERMASLGRLAAGVAHEINNPLAYVRTSLDIARRALERFGESGDPAQLERLQESLVSADDGVERVRVIAGDLKTFSRGDEGSWAPVDLRRVVDAAVNLASNEIRHRAELVREIGSAPPVMGSETRFVQVLVNLLVNAAHAIDEKGDPGDARITIRLGESNRAAVLEVEDTGGGISSDLRDRIFEPFWTSRRKARGTGLGLSICHGIITSAGGQIRVAHSEPGRGSTFRVELPAVGAAAVAATTSAPPKPVAPSARRARVLVVDDEPRLAMTIQLALDEVADVEVAEGGAAALAQLAEGTDYDMVLCDLMMPEVSGMDVYEQAVERFPEVAQRFVFMTGGAFTDRARSFLKENGLPRLDKPFAIADVTRLLVERL